MMDLWKLCCWILLFLVLACRPNEQPTATRPNIIIILADDMGYSDLGCYGSEIRTPHLDRLAAEGVRFSQFYNAARCCPSRAALLSGLYPHQAGIGGMTDTDLDIPQYQGFFNDSTVTIAQVLGNAGYTSYLAGKWHLGEEADHRPLDHGFDHCFAFINGAASYYDFKPYRNESWPPGNELAVVLDDEPLDLSDSTFYATDLYTDHAIRFIKDHSEDTPFFLYLGYTAPHWPLHALPEDIIRYEGTYDAGWQAVREARYRRQLELGLIQPGTPLSTAIDPSQKWGQMDSVAKARETRLMEVYAAMVDRMDQNIGRLLSSLEQQGRLDHTVIFFLSDNGAAPTGNMAGGKYAHKRFDREAVPGGPKSFTGQGRKWANVSNTPFRLHKSRIHEGGIATPFIAWSPKGFDHGAIVHQSANIVDLMPTVLELAQVEYPAVWEGHPVKPQMGVSLLPALRKKGPLDQRTMYFEHMSHEGMIENGWKAVRLRKQDWELYYLNEDRSEMNDLARIYPDRLELMVMKYNAWKHRNKILPREEIEARMKYKF
ncbi:MAG: arylsulfatase [Bacteroidota bacterium]